MFNTKSDHETFKVILDRNLGVGPGFDLLRVLLAIVILFLHARFIAGSGIVEAATGAEVLQAPGADGLRANSGWQGYSRPFGVALVPMFFALSGFLVMGSAERLRSTATFLAFRALRIVPALITEVIFSAVVLGTIFTSLTASEYFSHPEFWRYLGNAVGWIVFTLPGVFPSNPMPGVMNSSLWTLPAELDCYAITAILMMTGLLYRRTLLTIIMIAVTIPLLLLNSLTDFAVEPRAFAGHTITYYFFVGVMFYMWREKLTYSWLTFGVSAILSYVLLLLNHAVYLAPVFVTYCTLFIGLTKLPKFKFLSSGDYSYGIYLYHVPILQAVIASVPALRGHAILAGCVGCFLAFGVAAVSWHFIEKPTLKLKKSLPRRYFSTNASQASA